jgi:hypothetical protein
MGPHEYKIRELEDVWIEDCEAFASSPDTAFETNAIMKS